MAVTPGQLVDPAAADLHVRPYTERHVELYLKRHIRLYTDTVFPPELAMLLIGEFRKLARQSAGTNPITPREREVLILVARGHSYRQIGEELYISPKTVENHVRNTLDKLHLTRRDQLIRYAVEHGLE